MTRKNQAVTAKFLLNAFSFGIRALSLTETNIKKDLRLLGDGFTFAICASNNGPYIKLQVKSARLAKLNADPFGSDLVLVFKDLSGALPVLCDRISVEECLAQRRVQVYGSMSRMAVLARVINAAESRFFFLSRKIEGLSYDTGIL